MSAGQAIAKQTGASKKYIFKGRLIAITQCTINNDKVIDVSFGNVGINKVDTGQYVQDIHYTLDCPNAANTVTLVLKATLSGFDVNAMSTSVSALGVQILNNGHPVGLNTAIKIDPTNPPELQAKLIKDPARDLKEQEFTATGTLIAEYT